MQITVTTSSGATYNLISRTQGTLRTITSAKQSWDFLGKDVVNITVKSQTVIGFGLGDRITVFGKTYRLNQLPTMNKSAPHIFVYECEFESIQYDLMRATYDVNIDTTNNQLQDCVGDSLTGGLGIFMAVLVANACRLFGTGSWTYSIDADVTTASDVTLTFGESDNCLSVLQRLCDEFEVEFSISTVNGVSTIRLGTIGSTFQTTTFSYGSSGGLYELTRQNIDSSNIINRLKVFGSAENITSKYPSGYRSETTTNRSNRLMLTSALKKSQSYIEDAASIASYGVFEGTKIFEDIKPTFNGCVTGIDSSNVLKFTDTMMFDLNELDDDGNTKYLQDGTTAKIHFNSGHLAGYEFDVAAYDHTTHTFTLKPFSDEDGNVFPSSASAAFKIAVGNTYKIIDVSMPASYVTAAETQLATEAATYLSEHCQPRLTYGLKIASVFMRSLDSGSSVVSNFFAPGDSITINDALCGGNRTLRIKSMQRSLIDVYDYELTISDQPITVSTLTKTISDQKDIERVIDVNQLRDVGRLRANWRTARELQNMVFDTEGHYYGEKIAPLSIETQMIEVGARSQQFAIDVVLTPNSGNVNTFAWSAGTISHYAIEENIRTWSFSASSQSNLTAASPYYIYVKCAKASGSTASSIILSTTQKTVDSDSTYYYFLLGVLSSTNASMNNVRSISLLNGFTTINGRYVRTGRISSVDNSTYFDLDSGIIKGNISFINSDEEDVDLADFYDDFSEVSAQVDGKIESWYQYANPASNWGSDEKPNHVGDLWFVTPPADWGKVRAYTANQTWAEQVVDVSETQLLNLINKHVRIFSYYDPTDYEIGDYKYYDGSVFVAVDTARQGEYEEANWIEADADTTDAITNLYDSGLIPETQESYECYDLWVSDLDPVDKWSWSSAQKAARVGHLWLVSPPANCNTLWRYMLNGSQYIWRQINDATAVAAQLAASTAQDTADSKRQTFIQTPTPPYQVGDLWEDGTYLWTCITEKTLGQSYSASDWQKKTTYDNTKTTIDGGIVTSGTVQLAGSDDSIKAGITGQGTSDDSIRIWAGGTFADRANAPFRVLQDGRMYATNAIIQGGGVFNGFVQIPFVAIYDGCTWDSTNNYFLLGDKLNLLMSTGKLHLDTDTGRIGQVLTIHTSLLTTRVATQRLVVCDGNYIFDSQTLGGVSSMEMYQGRIYRFIAVPYNTNNCAWQLLA